MPMTSVKTALTVNAGVRRRERQAKRNEVGPDMDAGRMLLHLRHRPPRSFGPSGSCPATAGPGPTATTRDKDHRRENR